MIILVSGYRGSGKDTTADILVSRGMEKHSFASRLKSLVSQKYNIPISHTNDRELKDKAILTMPAMCEDSSTEHILKWISREFVTAQNQVPTDIKNINKKIVGRVNTTMYEQLYWTPRALCILEGSVARAVDKDYWISQLPLDKDIVVADWRFKSEYYGLLDLVGKDKLITLRINRASIISTDASERDLDNFDFDYTVENTGTIKELEAKISSIYETVLLRRGI